MAQHGHSEACCTVGPAQVDYTEQGGFIEVGGIQTYATGPATAKSAIFIIYDIFGFSKQILQGADILAHASDAHHQYRVFIPDLFAGKFMDVSGYPPQTDEAKAKLGEFFKTTAAPGPMAARIPGIVKELTAYTAANGEPVEQWGLLGLCWGGKIVSLASAASTPFKAAAEVHPAMVDPADGEKITIPICMLASGDEDPEAVKSFEAAVTTEKHVETFGDQIHGWMGARGDLKKERVRAEYERGYKTLLDFYHKYL